MTEVLIDGSAGTTGLRIRERLSGRADLELLTLSEEKRKDPDARRKLLNTADIAFLCLPDAAAVEAVSLVENRHTAVIDTSTAHRVSEGWAYCFAELSDEHRQAIVSSKRVANPGCHASGFIAGVYPLVKYGVIPAGFPLTAYSLTGYSGGSKKVLRREIKAGLLYHRDTGKQLPWPYPDHAGSYGTGAFPPAVPAAYPWLCPCKRQ